MGGLLLKAAAVNNVLPSLYQHYLNRHRVTKRRQGFFPAPGPHFIKSLYSIQKTPSLLPCAISSWRRCCGQSVHSSDQLPFQEKRPHGLRSRSSLKQRMTRSFLSAWLTEFDLRFQGKHKQEALLKGVKKTYGYAYLCIDMSRNIYIRRKKVKIWFCFSRSTFFSQYLEWVSHTTYSKFYSAKLDEAN